MNIAIAITVMLALVTTFALITWASFRVRQRRTSRNALGKELTLLADARAVERQAKVLLADAGETLALYDANTPFDMKQVAFGKGVMAARLAASEAHWAQLTLEYGEDFYRANGRLQHAKAAFVVAEEIAARGKIMAAVQGPTRSSHLREVPEVD